MAEYRVEDLPYGQLGDCNYDIEQKEWIFARQITYNHGIQPVGLPRQCLPPTLPRGTFSPSSQSRYTQSRNLNKRLPEIVPASFLTDELAKAATSDEQAIKLTLSSSSTLISFGKARDKDNRRGAIIDIVALASGKAGEVLRIIRPQLNKIEWLGHEDGVHIEALDPGTPMEECFWAGNGGTIQQITFATQENERSSWLTSSSTWLAVRDTVCTTILRPLYHRNPVPAVVPLGSTFQYPSSRIASNPIASIPIAMTGDVPHADVAFNPFYVRQVAVVDQTGSWSVWDMEGTEGKATFKTKQTKNGHLLDDYEPESRSEPPGPEDGWGRILWAGDVNTLIVCGRRHFAVFNIKGEKSRLKIPDLFSSMSSGWILDVKQNVAQLNHVFVLTSTRIFWLEIVSDNDKADDVKILYSCRHFRDEDGGNMKLDVLSEESSSNLLLYSSANALINTYRLSTAQNQGGLPECLDSSLICKNTKADCPSQPIKIHTIAALASPYSGNGNTGPGSRYQDDGILFYQLFHLSVDLELRVTLCSSTYTPEKKTTTRSARDRDILVPWVKNVKRITRQARFDTDADPFIVHDFDVDSDSASDDGIKVPFRGFRPPKKAGQQRPYALDFHPIFQELFHSVGGQDENQLPGVVSEDISDFVEALPERVNNWKKEEQNSMTRLLELAGSLIFSGDIDDVAATMRNMIRSLPEEAEDEPSVILTISQTTGTDSSLVQRGKSAEDAPLDLLAVYNHLIDVWVTCLPLRIPGSLRLMKERLIRKVAADLALSSVAISMAPPPPLTQKFDDGISDIDEMVLDRGTPFSSSQPEYMAEMSQRRQRSTSVSTNAGLPTPAYTPSLVSEGSTTTERGEDPAITALRKYVPNFPVVPPLGPLASRVLSHWVVGEDPQRYSYEAACRANAPPGEDDEFDGGRRRKKSKAARKKRGTMVDMASSQAAPMMQSSQFVPHIQSSQFIPDIRSSQYFPNMQSSQYMPNIQSSQYMPNIQPSQYMPNIQSSQYMPNMQSSQFVPNIQSSQYMPGMQSSQFIPQSSQVGVGVRRVGKTPVKKRKGGF